MADTSGSETRALGFWACTALVIGNMIGVSIFLVVIFANIPPLVWCLFPSRRRDEDPAAAKIFE